MAGKAKRNIVLAVLGALVLTLVLAVVFGKKGEEGLPVLAERVKVRDFSTTVSVSGQVEAEDAAVVRPVASGQVVEVLVEMGQTVRSGQLLARLDDRQARQVLHQAEEALSLARAELEAIRKANDERGKLHAQEKNKAERAAASARESLAQAQTRYDRLKKLHDDGVATAQQLEDAADQLRLAKERLADAEATMANLADSLGLQDTKLAETRVAQAGQDLATARNDLDLTMLRAPQNGTVLIKAVEPGVAVVPGLALFTIGTTERLRIKALVDEAYIVNIRLGQPVEVTNDALAGTLFTGRVTAIAPQGQLQDKLALFQVEIFLANRDGLLKPGMTVDCEIRTAKVPKVPVVPLLAVFDDDGGGTGQVRKYVFVMAGGKAKKTYITLGLTGEAEGEVGRGLRGGEMLITGEIDTLRNLQDGQAVRIKKTKNT